MAINFTTEPATLSPVYTDELKVGALEDTTTNLSYYTVELYINFALVDEFVYFPSPIDDSIEFDLSPMLSTYFESAVYQPTGTTVFEVIPDSIVQYHYIIRTFTDADVQISSTAPSDHYMFNGCFNSADDLSMTDFIMSSGDTGNFLTNWDTNRDITLNDNAYLNVIIGDFGVGLVSDFGGIVLQVIKLDGTLSNHLLPDSTSTKSILNINISPSIINGIFGDLINEDTKYLNIKEYGARNRIDMKINIIQENKFSKFYNFIYLNHLGGLDFFTATKVSNEDYSISKKYLDQFSTKKVYDTSVDEEIVVLTQPILASAAKGLKELFISPAVMVDLNDNYNSVIITNSKIVIQDRYPKVNIIQMSISFQYNYKYYVQKF